MRAQAPRRAKLETGRGDDEQPRSASARNRSSDVGSAQCRSSNASTTGCDRAPARIQAVIAANCLLRNSSGAKLAARPSGRGMPTSGASRGAFSAGSRPMRRKVPSRSARRSSAGASAPKRCRPHSAIGCHPHDRHRGVRAGLPAKVAADPNRKRHIMSQTACEHRRFPVPLHRLHAGGDLSRPDLWRSMRPAPVDTLQTPPGTLPSLSRPPPRAGMQVASPQCPASIECAANLKSP